jgi:hypothetical protein
MAFRRSSSLSITPARSSWISVRPRSLPGTASATVRCVSFDSTRLRIASLGLGFAAAVVATIFLIGSSGDDRGARDVAAQQFEAPPSAPARVGRPLADPGPGRVVGYVRDVNGNPVSGARVRVGGTRHGTRANARGRYRLRLPQGARALFAERRGYATQAVRLTGPAVRQRADFSLAATRADRTAGPNSADVLVFWADCPALAQLGRVELDRLIGFGVDGFVCMAGRLPGLGGTARFAAKAVARPAGDAYQLQRSLEGSAIADLARRGKLRMYLGFKASDYYNPNTPFKDWFDDAGWARDVLTPVRNLAAAARSLGFVGLAVDQEIYPGSGGAQSANWSWNYRGNSRSEGEVRAQVERRGRGLMTSMLDGYPGLELAAYATMVPGSWGETVQKEVNDDADAFADDVRVDLWAGLSSVPGYAAIRWLDAVFYKTPHVGGDWSVALQHNANGIYSALSRRFPNWNYASSRLHVTPFSWINEGPSPSAYDDAREPEYVANQLAAFRAWGTGGMFANYTYGGLTDFDYGPYADILRSASAPGMVDRQTPRLSVTSPRRRRVTDARLDIKGTVHDNFAVRVVRWYDGHDRFGTAKLVAQPDDGPDSRWVTRWRIRDVPVRRGRNRITVVAEDIKGLATVRNLTVRR